MTCAVATFSTNNTTGNRAISGLGLSPNWLRLTVTQKNSTTEAFIHFSQGFTDGVTSLCHSLYWDTSGGESRAFTDRVINHMTRESGALTNKVVATLVSKDADGFTLNFSSTVTGYRVSVEAGI